MSAPSSVYSASVAPTPLSTSEPASPLSALTSLNSSSDHLPSSASSTYSEGFATRAIHTGSGADPSTNAVIPAISLSTTYKQDAIGVHKGFEYTRSDNPNRSSLEKLLASLEGGAHTALALASGSAATGVFISSLGAASHVLSVNDVYGGTARYLRHVASATQGLTTTFIDMEKLSDDEILAEFKPNTKAVWIETPTNPTLKLIDVPRIVRLARLAPSNPLVLVDNTFMSPFFQSPLLLGADVVLHSLTKYVNGHSDVLMGALMLPPPEVVAGRGGFGGANDDNSLEKRLRYLQNAMGAVPSAFDAWLAQRGAKTLPLRMKAHGSNALRLAHWLDTEAKAKGLVKSVTYPGLPGTASGGRKGYELVRDRLLSPHARKWVESGEWEGARDFVAAGTEGIPFGGMVSFRIGDRVPSTSFPSAEDEIAESGAASSSSGKNDAPGPVFLASTHIFTLAESLGGIESLAELPAQMTHGSLPVEARLELGINDDLVRLSVGVEEFEDLRKDVEQALRWSVRGERWAESEGKWVQV